MIIQSFFSKVSCSGFVSKSKPVTISDLHNWESRYDMILPNKYAEFLMISNGLLCGSCSLLSIIDGPIGTRIETFLEVYPDFQRRKWTPFCTDGCGNVWIIVSDQSLGFEDPVCFLNTAIDSSKIAYAVASSFERFLDIALYYAENFGAIELDSWVFDKNKVLENDPELTVLSKVFGDRWR